MTNFFNYAACPVLLPLLQGVLSERIYMYSMYAALNNVVLNQTNYLVIWVITLDSEPLVVN